MIRKAILPVAGMGTRVLPATKVSAKELLPIVDKPLIQYAVEEAAAAGITEIIMVTAQGKDALLDHFDTAPQLEAALEAKGKHALLEIVRNTCPKGVTISAVRQPQPLGLGHAVWCARHLIGNEPFAVMLPDDLILGNSGALKQMVDAYGAAKGHMVAVENVPQDRVNLYGILDVAQEFGQRVSARGIVEKPAVDVAPSTLAVIGRYILDPSIMTYLDKGVRGQGGEIQLTDAIAATMAGVGLSGFRFEGRRYDCGNKAGYVAAVIDQALTHPETMGEIGALLEGYSRRVA